MKVAIVHDWLTGMRGGEKVLEVFCELWPEADLFTLLHVPGSVSKTIEALPTKTSFVQHLPMVEKIYRYYLPLFPWAAQRFDLREYDLVLSTSHCVVKGVITLPETCHISYIHTPMRYVWEMFDEYFGPGRAGPVKRAIISFFAHFLRKWDVKTASRVDYYICNSEHVRKRIALHYNRDAVVIHPPVDAGAFSISETVSDDYLVVSALAPYKRVDLAVRAFSKLGRNLNIVGSGQDQKRLLAMKGANIKFLGWQSTEQIVDLYATCKAFIFPGEEDFGITPLEAQAAGRPVIAYAKGGALETVVGAYPGVPHEGFCSGVFFKDQTVDGLCKAVKFFEENNPVSPPEQIRRHALEFDRAVFKEKIKTFVEDKFANFQPTGK